MKSSSLRRPPFAVPLPGGKLEIEFTVNDPKAHSAPWTIKLNQRIKLDTELLDYICTENEKGGLAFRGQLATPLPFAGLLPMHGSGKEIGKGLENRIKKDLGLK